ncbi:hypothetical protein N836_03565 [Leptolyngbya sp. Heron Island J]|uniref:hypothetical protein n=1 Tax=Leptolyngbya sp. Heron Island J TaxID=1385935 RepID=UPI0003B94B8A|nr:hypothetical protein [Leptolyngbya sp. Heron Island J]ESA37325.1 hypothetical protein N836_03565 [Leptolyngbya sp. Heron Island J]
MPRNRKKSESHGRLSANQIKAAGMLANGSRYINVAEACDVTDRTIRTWRKSDAFKKKIAEFQGVQSEEIQYALKASQQEVANIYKLAIATCHEIMSTTEERRDKYDNIIVGKDGQPIIDYKYSANARINAARTAIATAMKAVPNIEPPDTIEVAAAPEPDFSKERLKDVKEKIYGIY